MAGEYNAEADACAAWGQVLDGRPKHEAVVSAIQRGYDAGLRDGLTMKHEPPCAGTDPATFTCPKCKALGG